MVKDEGSFRQRWKVMIKASVRFTGNYTSFLWNEVHMLFTDLIIWSGTGLFFSRGGISRTGCTVKHWISDRHHSGKMKSMPVKRARLRWAFRCGEDTLKRRVHDIISWHGGGVEAHRTGELARQLVLKVLSAFIFFATMNENFVLEFFRNYLVLKCYIYYQHCVSLMGHTSGGNPMIYWFCVVFSDLTLIFFEFIRPTMLPFLTLGVKKKSLSIFSQFFQIKTEFLQMKRGKHKPWGMEDSLVHSSPLRNSLALASRSSWCSHRTLLVFPVRREQIWWDRVSAVCSWQSYPQPALGWGFWGAQQGHKLLFLSPHKFAIAERTTAALINTI